MKTIVLGAGFTGLAAGIQTGATVYEAAESPGGLGTTYEKDDYKFEIGGGHWLFGGDPAIKGFIKSHCEVKTYTRKSSVFFPNSEVFYSYPLQAAEQFQHMMETETGGEYGLPDVTMKDRFRRQFGESLCEKFFFPFNNLYTAGLYDKVAPQDEYKSPKAGQGYNVSFMYPVHGLGILARKMAARCQTRFKKRVTVIDMAAQAVGFLDGSTEQYDRLISTIPLNQLLKLAIDFPRTAKPDPHVSVLVLNIGAVKGKKCPNDHWVYVPNSKSGFHRVGFYSNVDETQFTPRGTKDRVSLYVERSFNGGAISVDFYIKEVINELRDWGWIDLVEVTDPTFVDVAYTYRWPNSTWREDSLETLKQNNIWSIGRFGAWKFQGIMESLKEGFECAI